MKQYLEERIAYLKNIEREKLNDIDKVPLGPLRITQWDLIKEIGARKNELQNALRWLETEQLHKPVVGGPVSDVRSEGEQLGNEGEAKSVSVELNEEELKWLHQKPIDTSWMDKYKDRA